MQGAFSACARVTGLEAFTETAEVKVDPDKPLEGARLEVLQVVVVHVWVKRPLEATDEGPLTPV